MKKLYRIAPITAALSFFVPHAFAAENVDINPPGPIPDLTFTAVLQFFINAFFAVAVLAALIYLLWGGLNWVLSGGDKDKIESARSRIIAAIVGLVLVVLAYFILDFVLQLLGLCGINHLQLPQLGQDIANTCP